MHRKVVALVAIVGTAVLAIHQPVRIAQAKIFGRNLSEAETAIATDVFDESAWKRVYPRPRQIISLVDLLRHDRKSIFSTKWPHLLGKELNTSFKENESRNCLGNFDALYAVPERERPGYRATGWAWDQSNGPQPRYVVLVADDGVIVGLARTGFIREGVKVVYPSVTWIDLMANVPMLRSSPTHEP